MIDKKESVTNNSIDSDDLLDIKIELTKSEVQKQLKETRKKCEDLGFETRREFLIH